MLLSSVLKQPATSCCDKLLASRNAAALTASDHPSEARVRVYSDVSTGLAGQGMI